MLKVGHRGASAYEPENTLRSFGKALELGVDAIEFDVRRTRDGRITVIHDADVERTTNGKGLVSHLSIEDIKKLTTQKGETLPTLEEALDFLDRKTKILIELKEKGLEESVLEEIRRRGLEKNVILISFHEEALKKVRELSSEVETGLIYVRHKDPVRVALDLRAQYLVALYRFVHTADVRKAHENGLKVIVWTINRKGEVPEYVKKGVDGIASDKPDILNIAG